MLHKEEYLIILIISILWIFIGGSVTYKIYDSYKQSHPKRDHFAMSTSEIEGFNQIFIDYEGVQSGSQVKALMNRLFANANTYKDEPSKIPSISYNSSRKNKDECELNQIDKIAYGVVNEGETGAYNKFINIFSKNLVLKHQYNVVITKNEDGLIAGITINYDKDCTSSNFIVSCEGEEKSINGLKGVTELVDGEIKTTSNYLDEINWKNSENTTVVVTTDNNEESNIDKELIEVE